MNSRLKLYSRAVCLISAIGLIAVLFLPLWRIELSAPQYPEGLMLQIFPDKIGGDVEVVNGLNHYIGMRTLHTKDFVEFVILPWIIGILAAFALISFLINRKWFFLIWGIFFIAFGIVAMADFYRWEYNYGHNLDSSAPIKVPGMAYQPPLIGYKKLLNFGAYSIPDAGGWIFIGIGVLLLPALVMELRKSVKMSRGFEIRATSIAVLLAWTLTSCSQGPRPIRFGSDNCDFCKMTITDRRFGGELVTKTGKAYVFDDAQCMHTYMTTGNIDTSGETVAYLVDFSKPGEFLKAEEGYLLKSENLKSPMGSHLAAFQSEDSLRRMEQLFPGERFRWNQLGRP